MLTVAVEAEAALLSLPQVKMMNFVVTMMFCLLKMMDFAATAADDGSTNRDSGPRGDAMGSLNGGDNMFRYRTGGSPGYTVDMTLDAPSDIEGVSITVRQSSSSAGEGYSGIEGKCTSSPPVARDL